MWIVRKKPYLKCMVNVEMNKRGALFKLEYGLLMCQARALPSLLFPLLCDGKIEKETEINTLRQYRANAEAKKKQHCVAIGRKYTDRYMYFMQSIV